MTKWLNHFISGKQFLKRPNLADFAFKKSQMAALGAWGKHRCCENVWIVGDEHVVVEVVASVFIVPRCCREIKYRQTFETTLGFTSSKQQREKERSNKNFFWQNKNEFSWCWNSLCFYVLNIIDATFVLFVIKYFANSCITGFANKLFSSETRKCLVHSQWLQ